MCGLQAPVAKVLKYVLCVAWGIPFFSVYRWEFMSTNHDVGFGVYMKSHDKEPDVYKVCWD